MAVFLAIPEWQRPWLMPFNPLLKDLIFAEDRCGTLCPEWRTAFNVLASVGKLTNHRGLPLRFVEQAALPPQIAYEAFISASGGVPTRENLHDFFNALVWLTYPTSKAELNAIQATEIERRATLQAAGITDNRVSVRGALRDRATIFDENAALLLTCERSLEEALVAHRWREILLEKRTEFGRTWEVVLFGHALIEKLTKPYKAITAHLWVLQVDQEFFDLEVEKKRQVIDALLCQHLKQGMLALPYAHLPVLGVPGWWERQDDAFYNDTAVFRPKRI